MTRRAQFLNRETSWLQFNRRVLDEAQDASVPLLERVKFLAITASNLDEFFMVRVGGLQQLAEQAPGEKDPAGLTPGEQLDAVGEIVRGMVAAVYACLPGIETRLKAAGIVRQRMETLTPEQEAFVERLFTREIFPALTPVAVRRLRAFPLLPGLGINMGVRIGPGGAFSRRDRFAVVAIPRTLPRCITLPTERGYAYILVEDIVTANVGRLFPGEQIANRIVFRITRNADLEVREDQAGDLLRHMQRVLWERRQSACVRLETGADRPPGLLALLVKALQVSRANVYACDGPLDPAGFGALAGMPGFDALRDPAWPPQTAPAIEGPGPLFDVLAGRDLLLFHPYEAFDPVVRLINEAADDRAVLAIKQVLYRTSPRSPIVAALGRAAERGKHVTAIVELKARFDEARNIEWARALERAGVQVIYGIRGLKTHAKACLIVRREAGGIRRYVHFGTGNYNEITARVYSDVSFLTCREDYGADTSLFFNTITGYSQPVEYERLSAAPLGLRRRLLDLLEGESQRAREGLEARVLMKLNSLVDTDMIQALYRAARAGVKIQLNVRGICCLRPGVPGLSENIRVVSVVDRFLEHARILYFHHGGKPLVFISSADWMPRNLDRRIELLVSIEDPECRARLLGILDASLRDTAKGAELQPDGTYRRLAPAAREKPFRSQEFHYQQTCAAVREADRRQTAVFEPLRPGGAAT